MLFTAGGIATPADAAMMMQLGAEGVFVGSGIFKSENPSLLAKAMVEATEYGNNVAVEFNARDKDLIAKAGKAKIQQLSKEDVEAWRKAVEPVWNKFEKDIGRDLIDAALASNNK